MLSSLSIKNYALIDDLQVSFGNGLTIITGETGAGKSILLGGLSLILGKRADMGSVKDASKKCVIEGVFDIANYNLKDFFSSEELDYETQTIIRREILPSGKSRAFINDTPVTLDSLQNLGLRLLDIHSQHQTLDLVDNEFQFQVIDALANNSIQLNTYQEHLKTFRKLTSELVTLESSKAESIKEQDYHLFLLNELEEAKIKEGDLQELEDEYETLNNVEFIQEKLALSHGLMSNDEAGVTVILTEIKQHLSRLASFSENYKSLQERISSSLIELDDVLSEIENLQESLEANPNRLEAVNARLQVLNNLFLKHSVNSEKELLNIQSDLQKKVTATENLDGEIAKKQKEIEETVSFLETLSEDIHKSRKTIIPGLIEQLESALGPLGMPNDSFKIELKQTNSFFQNGKDTLEFLFTANKGGQFQTLKKAASGGELSRIMLTIKSVLASYTQLPTIMFDEIDTGVSGEISNKMGDIMKAMSRHMQVFTITHLPQIAAKGDTHFKVFKEDVNDATRTDLRKLNGDERVVEIAQMLGGTKVTTSAMAHAKQLLN